MTDASATAVFEALDAGETETLRALIAADPALAGASRADGMSAVLWARYRFDLDALAILLAAEPALDAFEAAAVGDEIRLGATLAMDPALATAFSTDGFTALGLAAFFGHPGCVRMLLAAGADPNAASQNPMRVAPLHSALAGRHTAIAAALLDAGANVNAIQADGFTPLHEAAQNGDEPAALLLLVAGADPHVARDDGQTPADTARIAGHDELAARLQAAAKDTE